MKPPRSDLWAGDELEPAEAGRRLHELSALYEAARHLVGAREPREVGARLGPAGDRPGR